MHDSVRQFILYYRLLRGDGSPSFPQDGGTLYSFHSQTTFFLQNTVLKIFEIKVALSFPFPCVPSRYWLAGDSISKKKKNVRARDVVIFSRISDQKSVFLRIDLEKNCFFFYQTRFERDALSSPRFHKQYRKCNIDSLPASSAQESYFSQGDTKNYSFSLFITMHKYIYIYIIRTSVSQFLRESKREDRSGLIIVKGISN